MKLYAVSRTVGGYAREDAARSETVGVYTDREIARKIAVLSGGIYEEVELNYIWAGIRAYAPELGIELPDKISVDKR